MSELVDIRAELVHETEQAYLIRPHFGTDEVWVPKSRVEHDEAKGIFTMEKWLAHVKGLE